ncbi:MAG: phosphoribosyltransferase family protein, partial [Planctomycetota bacterium]
KCGAFLSSASPLPDGCAHCHTRVFPFERAIALGNYTGLLQTLTLKAKNLKDESLTIQLANLLAFRLQEYSFCDELDLVVPVSTHWWTRLKRGFHAAEILGQIVSQRLEIPCGNSCLKSLKLAKKQGTLSANERYKNVRATFGVRKLSKVHGKKILVIDDVLTSGATASEVSKELLKAGASQVYVGVVARAVGDH